MDERTMMILMNILRQLAPENTWLRANMDNESPNITDLFASWNPELIFFPFTYDKVRRNDALLRNTINNCTKYIRYHLKNQIVASCFLKLVSDEQQGISIETKIALVMSKNNEIFINNLLPFLKEENVFKRISGDSKQLLDKFNGILQEMRPNLEICSLLEQILNENDVLTKSCK